MFFRTITYVLSTGTLSVDQRTELLSIIPKKAVDLRYLKSWRPLTLLNTDCMILAKVLSASLQNVINELVNNNPNGYIKGRCVRGKIRTISDVFEFSNMFKIAGIIIIALIDF